MNRPTSACSGRMATDARNVRPKMMLETTRLILRKLRATDYDDYFRLYASLQPAGQPASSEFVRGLLKHYLEHQRRFGYSMYAVLLRATGRFIGNCGLEHYQWEGYSEVEIAYDIHREFWGQGYATEAAAAVRDFAFGKLGLEKIVSYIVPGNRASRRVAEKIGLCVEREILKDDRPHLVYALERTRA